jgi:hypothetical protein
MNFDDAGWRNQGSYRWGGILMDSLITIANANDVTSAFEAYQTGRISAFAHCGHFAASERRSPRCVALESELADNFAFHGTKMTSRPILRRGRPRGRRDP